MISWGEVLSSVSICYILVCVFKHQILNISDRRSHNPKTKTNFKFLYACGRALGQKGP